MALVPIATKHQLPKPTPNFHSSPSFKHTKTPQMAIQNSTNITKRTALIIAVVSALYTKVENNQLSAANAFDFSLVAPEQTLEEAENSVKGDAKNLLKVKELLEEESWKAAQRELRKISGYLKQDIYTIIQNKPGIQRAELRVMYSNLFDSVTRLDYAARDKDVLRIWECYNDIVVALDQIFSRII